MASTVMALKSVIDSFSMPVRLNTANKPSTTMMDEITRKIHFRFLKISIRPHQYNIAFFSLMRHMEIGDVNCPDELNLSKLPPLLFFAIVSLEVLCSKFMPLLTINVVVFVCFHSRRVLAIFYVSYEAIEVMKL